MGEMMERGVWKFAVITDGGPYVMMDGISEMLLWPVHNWRTQIASILLNASNI
jgi:hypothetical protein